MKSIDDVAVEILKKKNLFYNIFDIIRIVDPKAKKVLTYKGQEFKELPIRCFDFWERGTVCDNCISIRAINDGKKYIKVEYAADKVYTALAIPFELDDRRVVAELLMEASNSMFYWGTNEEQKSEVYGLVDEINRRASMDELTGVYNRRFIDEKLPVDIFNAILVGKQMAVIMADIDFFKSVNDKYGHVAGDAVLKEFAKKLSSCLRRKGDWVARYGGEEFLVCLPNCEIDPALKIAELMRKEIEDMAITYNGNVIKITSSFGVLSENADKISSVNDLLERVDKIMYLSKVYGRNRVES